MGESIAEVAAALREANALNDTLVERGSRLVIAYHTAICSPKGVVPMDEFYDPILAARIQAKMDARCAPPPA